jgi:hypothetical protein
LFVDRFGQVVYVGDHASAWALRDIKAKRTKLTPAGQSDLETLIEMGRFVEMRDDALMLTNMGHQAFDQWCTCRAAACGAALLVGVRFAIQAYPFGAATTDEDFGRRSGIAMGAGRQTSKFSVSLIQSIKSRLRLMLEKFLVCPFPAGSTPPYLSKHELSGDWSSRH